MNIPLLVFTAFYAWMIGTSVTLVGTVEQTHYDTDTVISTIIVLGGCFILGYLARWIRE